MNTLPFDDAQRVLLDRLLGQRGVATAAVPRIPRRPAGSPPPLSFAQQRLWFLHRLDPGSTAYNVPLTVPFPGGVDAPTLARTLNEIARRHEVLRTSFALADGQPVQCVAPLAAVPLPVTDLRSVPVDQRPEAAGRLAREEAGRPFDLATGPVWRARLLHLTDTQSVLLLTLHHIVADAWSLEVLAREMTLLYEAYLAGRPSPLPELAVQYADFAVWQRAWLAGERLEQQLGYWRERLEAVPVPELPTDRPRPAVATHRGALHRFAVPAPLAATLRGLAQAEGVTLFMLLVAVFKILLHRYSGQPDVLVGTPIAGRVRAELEPLIGFFVNTLVLRTSLAGHPTFRQALERVRAAALGAYAHQDLPFEELVEALQPERDLSRNPLFQVMFQVLNAPAARPAPEPAATPWVEPTLDSAKFDLAVTLRDAPDRLEGLIEYNADLFEADSMARLARHYVNLATALARDPTARIGTVDFLDPAERHRLLAEWNATAVEHPPEPCLHRWIERQAALRPDAVAVVGEGPSLTYRELDERANRLARHLQVVGLTRDGTAAVCLERSPDLVVSILAILKAGGAYVPLDPEYPRERLAHMLEDSQAMAVVCNTASVGVLPPTTRPIVRLDRDAPSIGGQSPTPPDVALDAENLAYVLYTSGSTGKPKGVMVPHRAIANHMHWIVNRFGMTERDAVLQKTPLSFDASVWELFAPLMTGGRLVLARQGGHKDSTHLEQAIQAHQVTILQLVPSQLRLLLEHLDPARCASLRLVFCGGEPLAAELCQRFQQCLRAELHNLYGPTEATIDATSWSCQGVTAKSPVLIGRPIDNLRAYVLDAYGQLAPPGAPGLLYLGGRGLARGYRNQPALTAERFVPDPFSGEPGSRLYCTGDRVRHRPSGDLEYLGRADAQVKLRGYRIELREIERVLESHPTVRQAVVVVRRAPDTEPRLAAYVVFKPGTPPTADDLRVHLRRFLPDYMLPASLTPLDRMPLTPNGKLDGRALPDPEAGAGLRRADWVPPQEPLEREIAEVWQAVLGVEAVGLHDNFFDLGGHSLLLVQVQHRLQNRLRCDLPLLDLFRYPSVKLLAARLAEPVKPGRNPAPVGGVQGAAEPPPARQPRMQSRPLFKRPSR